MFSSPRPSLPSLARPSRKAYRPSKHPANFSSAVLLSPINCKALDIPFPSGGSSPAFAFMQSPSLQAATATSRRCAARVFSPPIHKLHDSSLHLFRSPLHPLAYQNLENHCSEDKTISNKHGFGKISERFRYDNFCSKGQATSVVDHFPNKSLRSAEKESNQMVSKGNKATQRRSSRAKRSPLIVDCGCHPSFSSSFRKTKTALQSCTSSRTCSKPNIACVQNILDKDAMKKHNVQRSAKSSRNGEAWENSVACSCPKLDTVCPVLPSKQDHHCHELSQKKLQLKKRRKRMDAAEITKTDNSRVSLLKQQGYGHTSGLIVEAMNVAIDRTGANTEKGLENCTDCSTADKKTDSSFSFSSYNCPKDSSLLMEASTLAWEKDFSSFTSEDTFFSSFERSRPSFSSNSSSECFDRKFKPHAGLASNSEILLITPPKSSTRSADDLNFCNPALSSSTSSHLCEDTNVRPPAGQIAAGLHPSNKLRHMSRSMPNYKAGDPLVKVSLHGAVDRAKDDKVALMSSYTHICTEPAREHTPRINTTHGSKRGSSFNPLFEIKEDPSEGRDTGILNELDQIHGSRKCRSSLKNLNLPKIPSSADYTLSSHSDYYADAHADRQRRARVRKKTAICGLNGWDSGSARIRRQAHLQARWRLRDEQQIERQSSVDGDAQHHVGCTTLDSQLMHSITNEHGFLLTQNNSGTSSPAQNSKAQHSEMIHASMEAPKASSTALQSSNCTEELKPDTVGVVQESKCVNANKAPRGRSYATNPRLNDSVAVVKCSKEPLVDFKESMVDMIIEKKLYSMEDLGELLQCFLSLNSHEHYAVILQAFGQVWGKLFRES